MLKRVAERVSWFVFGVLLVLFVVFGRAFDAVETLLRPKPCSVCQNSDGSPNTEYLNENGECTFGCGSRVNNDHKVCDRCEDHSANAVECERCVKRWERWSDFWEIAK